MKNYLYATTALAGAGTLLAGGTAFAAEAPTWKLTGNMNFQFYNVSQDLNILINSDFWTTSPTATSSDILYDTSGAPGLQDHGWYFGVDEAELQLDVSGTADNGLNYGFKIEIQTNTDDGAVADEARLQLSGGWGTVQLGDEDGAEDIMNYGGETLMGATGGFDGDFDDVLLRNGSFLNGYRYLGAPSGPTIVGDTSDATKISYFSPRFSGFQVGASLTPTPNDGDDFKADGQFENHIGIGANYDSTFGDLRVRGSAVYVSAGSVHTANTSDISAWSVGGIIGFGPFSVGANYTDNGDSAMWNEEDNATWWSQDSSYWDVAASFETGPMGFSVGYFVGTAEYQGTSAGTPDGVFENIALTADYTMAPGLGVYAEVDMITDEIGRSCGGTAECENSATIFIAGANVSF